MSLTAAQKSTSNGQLNETKRINDENPRRLFFVTTMNMSWQLAVAVLVPVVGGFKLDQEFGLLPVLTLVGFVVAIACTVIVIKRQLKMLESPEGKK